MKNRFSRITVLIIALLCAMGLSGCGKAEPSITLVTITPGPEQSLEPASLAGGWYGYWSVSETTRDWKSLEGKNWDCCAEVLDEDDGVSLLLWDEDMPRDNYLAKLRLKEEGGRYSCTGGDFLDVAVTPEDVGLQLLNREGLMLQITGWCNDAVTGSFYYTFYLRPWGDTWPDAGRKPPHYESWYLPKVEAGSCIPNRIDVK